MDEKKIYERIENINKSLDELARDVKGEEQNLDTVMTLNETVNNEVIMPTVDINEVNSELSTNDKGGKGQIILIVILSIVLVLVLASMIYFVNSL